MDQTRMNIENLLRICLAHRLLCLFRIHSSLANVQNISQTLN